MDVPLYDVYLTGQLADDVSPALAAQRLAALFKSSPAAMAALITGKTQLLKRGVDKNTALKYREALQKAGCEVAFKAQANAPAETAPTPPQAATNPAAVAADGPGLAPAGADLLRPEERHTEAPASVDTSHLSLAPVGPLPTAAAPAVAPPDTSHLALTAAEGNLLDESEHDHVPAIEPDTSELSLAEAGAPIETLKTDAAPLHPDTSGLQLTPAGGDLLTPAERSHPQPAAPNTDHIKLAPQPARFT